MSLLMPTDPATSALVSSYTKMLNKYNARQSRKRAQRCRDVAHQLAQTRLAGGWQDCTAKWDRIIAEQHA